MTTVESAVSVTVNMLLVPAVTLSFIGSEKVTTSLDWLKVALEYVGNTPSTFWFESAATAACVRAASTAESPDLIVTPAGTLSLFAAKPSPAERSPVVTV